MAILDTLSGSIPYSMTRSPLVERRVTLSLSFGGLALSSQCKIRAVACIIAVGVCEARARERLCFAVSTCNEQTFWRTCLLSPGDNGLLSLQLVDRAPTSKLTAALASPFQ